MAGGLAGAVARMGTAPLDRVKLLFQVQVIASAGTSSTAYTSVGQAFSKILRWACRPPGLYKLMRNNLGSLA